MLSAIEVLEQELFDRNVRVVCDSIPKEVKGLYWDNEDEFIIIISRDLGTNAERLSVLAEEAGHHFTSTGNILGLDDVMQRRQERRARGWAYEQLVSPEKLIKAWQNCDRTSWEMAEYCDVPEDFFLAAIEYYRQKYWPALRVDGYEITFEPFNIKKIER